jgi:Mg-chelatase subunit ChlD
MRVSFSNPAVLWTSLVFLPLLVLPFVGRKSSLATRHILSAILRLLIGVGLILGLAGARLAMPVDDVTVVFVLDLSDSVPAAERERAEAFIRQSVSQMPPGSQAAVVAFGEEPLVERLASDARDLPPIASVPGASLTDIAAAIRLALALFPEGSQKRLVLLSDGLENVGDARSQVDLAAARGVEIALVPLLAPPAEQEAYLAGLEVPASVRQGQSLVVTAIVESTLAQEATLRLMEEGRLLESRTVPLAPGTNRVQIAVTAGSDGMGLRRYHAELSPALDTLPQNNTASGFTIVYGPPRLLVVEGEPGEADALRRALASTYGDVTVVVPQALPVDVATLTSYDGIVLVDVPADALPDGAMEALPVVVRELGRGLVMIGGERGYGAGGYLRTPLEQALPVDMDVRSRTKEPNLALVLAVDKSGSMGRCHCDDPDARPGEYVAVETGLPKVDIAKDAIMMARNALGSLDYLGVVAFNENALWAMELQQLAEAVAIQQAIGGLQAEGQTNIFAGLVQAEEALAKVEAQVKHIILVTDGWSNSGEYTELTKRLADEGITLSVVAAGRGSPDYLRGLAEAGGGRYYPVPTIQELPQIFFRETIETVGSYIVEEPFYPLPAGTTTILRGLDPMALPPLLGYNGTTPKATAQVGLVSPRGDPVLAQWQYGLGRAAAWTSDVKGRWAADWVEWERFNHFTAQLVGWTLPDPADDGLQVTMRMDGADVRFQVDSTTEDGRPRDLLHTEATLIGPDLDGRTVVLEQTAAGRYEGSTAVAEPGTYLVQVVQREPDDQGQPVAQQTAGLIMPYSPEYKRVSTLEGEVLLNELARATGGAVLASPQAAFAPTRRPASQAHPLWPSLLLMAALLFPLDVGVRRLRLTAADWRRLMAWVGQRTLRRGGRPSLRPVEPVLLGDLFEARERARIRGARGRTQEGGGRKQEAGSEKQEARRQAPIPGTRTYPGKATAPGPGAPVSPPTSATGVLEPKDAGPSAPLPLPEGEDTLARLREARERARRRR